MKYLFPQTTYPSTCDCGLWLVACGLCTMHHVPSPNIEQVHSNYKKQLNALEEKYRVTTDAVHGVQVIVVNDMYNIKQ